MLQTCVHVTGVHTCGLSMRRSLYKGSSRPSFSSSPCLLPPFPHHVAIPCEPSPCGCVEVALQMPRCHWTGWRHFQRRRILHSSNESFATCRGPEHRGFGIPFLPHSSSGGRPTAIVASPNASTPAPACRGCAAADNSASHCQTPTTFSVEGVPAPDYGVHAHLGTVVSRYRIDSACYICFCVECKVLSGCFCICEDNMFHITHLFKL